MKKSIFGFSVHDIVEMSLLCAVAIILDKFVKISIGATGGSINIAMFPLVVISLRHGPFKGFVAGCIVFGLITCLLDDYGIATYPLEYLVSFGSIGLLGFFARIINENLVKHKFKKSIFAYLIVVLCLIGCAVIRTLAGTIDSIILWDYEFVPALVYNISYVLPSMLIVIIITMIMLPYIKMLNNLFKTSYLSFEK